MVFDWRSALNKYSKLPGIRSLHNFIFIKNSATNKIVAKVRDDCSGGAFQDTSLHVRHGRDIGEDVILGPDQSYTALSKVRDITDTKRKHLQQMYKDFIPSDRRLTMITLD